jgi:hypothetical protein
LQMALIIGRRLSRIAHCNPVPVFDAICVQLKVYDNLIGVVVDSLK